MDEITAPRVSVVLPTYNRDYCLARSIDSVLNQTFIDFELLILDDGSTDGTPELVANYDDHRVQYFRFTDNAGQTKRLNQGIEAARGALIAFQDSDDEWLPCKLEMQVHAIDDAPSAVGVVYCDRWRIAEGNSRSLAAAAHFTPEDGLRYEDALNGNLTNIATQCLLVKRKCFEAVGGFDERLQLLNDREMMMRLSKSYLLLHVGQPLVKYHVSGDAMTARGEAAVIKSWEIIYEKYKSDLAVDRGRLARIAYWIGSFHMRTSNGVQGRRYLSEAFKANPVAVRYSTAYILSWLGSPTYAFVHKLMSR